MGPPLRLTAQPLERLAHLFLTVEELLDEAVAFLLQVFRRGFLRGLRLGGLRLLGWSLLLGRLLSLLGIGRRRLLLFLRALVGAIFRPGLLLVWRTESLGRVAQLLGGVLLMRPRILAVALLEFRLGVLLRGAGLLEALLRFPEFLGRAAGLPLRLLLERLGLLHGLLGLLAEFLLTALRHFRAGLALLRLLLVLPLLFRGLFPRLAGLALLTLVLLRALLALLALLSLLVLRLGLLPLPVGQVLQGLLERLLSLEELLELPAGAVHDLDVARRLLVVRVQVAGAAVERGAGAQQIEGALHVAVLRARLRLAVEGVGEVVARRGRKVFASRPRVDDAEQLLGAVVFTEHRVRTGLVVDSFERVRIDLRGLPVRVQRLLVCFGLEALVSRLDQGACGLAGGGAGEPERQERRDQDGVTRGGVH